MEEEIIRVYHDLTPYGKGYKSWRNVRPDETDIGDRKEVLLMANSDFYRTKVEEVMSRIECTVKPTDPISEALGKMKKHKVMEIPVVEGDKFRGFIKLRTLTKRRKIPLNAQTRSFMVSPPKVKPKDKMADAAEMLVTRDYTSIPVTVKTSLKGMVSRRDIIKGMLDDDSISSIPIETIMNFAPLAVGPTDSVFQALAQMELTGEASAAVVDDRNKFLGVVTTTGLATIMELPPNRRQLGTMGPKGPRNREVSSMAFGTETLPRTSTVKEAINLLLRTGLPTAYVLDGSELAGSVGEVDILEVLLRGKGQIGPYVQIAGMEESKIMDTADISDIIQKYVSRINKIYDVNAVTVRIKHHHYDRDEDKYTVNVKVTLKEGVIAREGYDYDLGAAVEIALDAVEKQVKKTHDKRVR